MNRWIWKETPWRRTKSRGEDDITEYSEVLSSTFQKVRPETVIMRFWYPKTASEFTTSFEEAAHHVHYHRSTPLESLLKAHSNLVNQIDHVSNITPYF